VASGADVRSEPGTPPDGYGRVASATPGRLRVRLGRSHRQRALMERAQSHLGAQSGVRDVATNAATGSIVVRYDPEQRSGEDVLALLADAGVIVRDVLGADRLPEIGHSRAARTLVDALADLDRRVSHATGHRVDLKLLFPAALGLLGVRQVASQGLGLSQVPGYILLWYAFDAFVKLHQPRRPGPEETARAAESDGAVLGGA